MTECAAHHWLLPSPTPGCETIEARCKRCDATRSMPAYFDEDIFAKSMRMSPAGGKALFRKQKSVAVFSERTSRT